MLYRVHRQLSTGKGKIPRGTLSNLEEISEPGIKALLDKGVISEVQSPPLRILPEWETRAELLADVGIETVDQLLSADLEEIAYELNVKLEDLEKSAEEAKFYIQVT